MESIGLLQRAKEIGLKVWAEGDSLEVEGSPSPDALAVIKGLQQHKREILTLLNRPKLMPGPKEWHAQEIAQVVEREGICIFWAEEFKEMIAFIKNDTFRELVPPGIVAYTSAELLKLFGGGKTAPLAQSLRFIHEAKKQGARIAGL